MIHRLYLRFRVRRATARAIATRTLLPTSDPAPRAELPALPEEYLPGAPAADEESARAWLRGRLDGGAGR